MKNYFIRTIIGLSVTATLMTTASAEEKAIKTDEGNAQISYNEFLKQVKDT